MPALATSACQRAEHEMLSQQFSAAAAGAADTQLADTRGTNVF